LATIIRKELADYFSSIRCIILFALILLVAALGLVAAFQGIREAVTGTGFVFAKLFTTSGEVIPSFVGFIVFFVPIIGIILGFDAINSERSSGTLSRLLSQPVYRDSIINGKFLAGLATLSIMLAVAILIVAGFGLRMIGVPPSTEEVIRLFIYLVFTIIYGAFWMSLAILFSVVFRRIATSLLPTIAIWLFFSFFYTSLIVPAVAKSSEMFLLLRRLSPGILFEEATTVLLIPQWRGTGMLTAGADIAYMLPNPLSLGQSLIIIWPQLIALIALTAICFAVSYMLFMRQEIRAT